MGKKQKSEPHLQVKELTRDLVYKDERLPADVVYEILVRLPVESLVKFRCVCKQWCSLISHPSFQQDHYQIHSQEDPLFLIIRKEFDQVSRTNVLKFSTYDINEETVVSNFSKSLPLLPLESDILLIQSCQGLMCLVDHGNGKRHIFLCNPSTRELIALPPTNEANECVAFGFAESRKEFKLVRFFSRKELAGTMNLCEVFTSDTSEWREAKCPPQNRKFSPRAYFLHGAIHLEPLSNGPIHAFDIESEEYRVIPLPKICDSTEMEYKPHFNEFSGFLCLTMYFDRRYELWLLKDYNNEKWVKEYTMDNFFFNLGTPSAILGDGSLVLDIYVGLYGYGELYCYNLHDRTYTQKLECHDRAKATSYVGSLFALGR